MTLPLLGTAVLTQEACKLFLMSRNKDAALEPVDHYFEIAPKWGIRADTLVCQMFHETGYLTSWWSQPPRHNMAGVGVTGQISATDPKAPNWAFHQEINKWEMGYSFPDWTTGVQAHVAHMSAYVYLDERNNASKLDPRYAAAHSQFTSKKWTLCTVATDLNGRWAVPGTDYGQRIEMVYNTIAALPPSGGKQTF